MLCSVTAVLGPYTRLRYRLDRLARFFFDPFAAELGLRNTREGAPYGAYSITLLANAGLMG